MPDGPQHEYRSFAVDIGGVIGGVREGGGQQGGSISGEVGQHEKQEDKGNLSRTSIERKPKEKAYDFQSIKLQMVSCCCYRVASFGATVDEMRHLTISRDAPLSV